MQLKYDSFFPGQNTPIRDDFHSMSSRNNLRAARSISTNKEWSISFPSFQLQHKLFSCPQRWLYRPCHSRISIADVTHDQQLLRPILQSLRVVLVLLFYQGRLPSLHEETFPHPTNKLFRQLLPDFVSYGFVCAPKMIFAELFVHLDDCEVVFCWVFLLMRGDEGDGVIFEQNAAEWLRVQVHFERSWYLSWIASLLENTVTCLG